MNKVLRKTAERVLSISIVERGLDKVCQFYLPRRSAEVHGRIDALKAFVKLRAKVLKSKEQPALNLVGSLSEKDAKALESLVDYITPQFAEIKGRLHAMENFLEDRAKAPEGEEQPDLREAVSAADAKALENVVSMVIKDGMTVVEVGSWKGMSTSVLAKAVANYNGKVFAVDHWMGNEEGWNYDIAKAYDVFSIFKRNMILLGVWDIVHPLVMDSQTASQIFADGIVDLVFIDADHRYEGIKKDISSWYPKLKDGGILCGHDCEGYYTEFSEEVKKMIDEHLADDYIHGIHPGVVKAVYEYFQKQYFILPDKVWYYIKKERHPHLK